jgi:hypothetical protein
VVATVIAPRLAPSQDDAVLEERVSA